MHLIIAQNAILLARNGRGSKKKNRKFPTLRNLLVAVSRQEELWKRYLLENEKKIIINE